MRICLLLVVTVSLFAQDFSDYKILTVSQGHTFTEGPAWSPEGQWLAFTTARHGDYEIYATRMVGTEARRAGQRFRPGRHLQQPGERRGIEHGNPAQTQVLGPGGEP